MRASLPQGTRDFGPETVAKRNYIFKTIRQVFELYGFQPLETPAMENLETLTGKYGEEGDKLIFKILNNGLNDPKNRDQAKRAFDSLLLGKADKALTERALRYDLTIPFARYVSMNHGQLSFPFKRYQLQPVWRADRPQKGRYREFWQCDADTVGSQSLLNEVELADIYARVFEQLGIEVVIRINHREILGALAEQCGGGGNMLDITTAIDKLGKIGMEKVKEELAGKLMEPWQIEGIEQYLSIQGTEEEKMEQLNLLLGGNERGKKGIDEIAFVMDYCKRSWPSGRFVSDFTLARGLNYYTGIIFEVQALASTIGSLGGGGRYDDLTGLFDLPNLPGVGISFGLDRIYDVMEELNLFPPEVQHGTQVLFFNLGEQESKTVFTLMQQLREKGIPCELYPDKVKFDKQFKYADKKNIPFVVFIGPDEIQSASFTVKDLRTGVQQQALRQADLTDFFLEALSQPKRS
jgi:histidyl-tRNA synthetase